MSPLARLTAALAGSALAFTALGAHAAPADSACSWLVGQKGRSGLYASFQGGNVADTCDQAVAAIAFLVRGDTTGARALLTKLQGLTGWLILASANDNPFAQ